MALPSRAHLGTAGRVEAHPKLGRRRWSSVGAAETRWQAGSIGLCLGGGEGAPQDVTPGSRHRALGGCAAGQAALLTEGFLLSKGFWEL